MLDTEANDYTWDMVDDDVVAPRPAPVNPNYVPTEASERSDDDEDYSEARAAVPEPARSDGDNATLVDEIDSVLSDKDGDLDAEDTETCEDEDVNMEEMKPLAGSRKVTEDLNTDETMEQAPEASESANTESPDGPSAPPREPPTAKFLKSIGWKPRHTASVRIFARKSKEVVSTATKNVRDLHPHAFEAVASQTRQATESSAQYVQRSSRRLREWDEGRLKLVPASRRAASVLHSQARVLIHQIRKFEADHRIVEKSKAYLEQSAKTIQRFFRRRMQNRN